MTSQRSKPLNVDESYMSKKAKKTTPKATKKKKVNHRRKKLVVKKAAKALGLIDMDEVLRKVNYVQIQRKSVSLKVAPNDAPMVANILKDAGLVVDNMSLTESCVFYEVSPGERPLEGAEALEGLEELSDEIPEDGQLFD